MGVAGGHDGRLEESVVVVDGLEHVGHEHEEPEVLLVVLAGGHESDAGLGSQGPVAVLPGSVDAREGLLVQEHLEPVLLRGGLHEGHQLQVVVDGEVGLLVHGGDLELVRGDLVVPGLDGDPELVSAELQVLHELEDAGGDASEVVILQLLVPGGVVTDEGPLGHDDVRAEGVQSRVDEEVFLLPPEVGEDGVVPDAEVSQNVGCRLGDGGFGLQEGRLVVQGLSGIGDEDCGDAQGVPEDEYGG